MANQQLNSLSNQSPFEMINRLGLSQLDDAQLDKAAVPASKMVRTENLSSFAISDDELKHRSLSMVIAENIILSLAH
ncbi:hypothetical protein IC617_12370 [Neiella sp. HB171785]|uniref:Uncharacterized protein n=1 Tax=Neiella litorisoli TaxID=2771431 RepID=A0A8J6UJ99_9GAMM|nr:hypothetical protein [Neiella litorisoli]MBD1390228.1 hypothetical protein [Neiella litorisoli]